MIRPPAAPQQLQVQGSLTQGVYAMQPQGQVRVYGARLALLRLYEKHLHVSCSSLYVDQQRCKLSSWIPVADGSSAEWCPSATTPTAPALTSIRAASRHSDGQHDSAGYARDPSDPCASNFQTVRGYPSSQTCLHKTKSHGSKHVCEGKQP